jgi:NADH-quinone oxidoreductase subunit L
LTPLTRLSRNKFYLDEVYLWLIVMPLRGVALVCRFFDWGALDGVLVGGVGRLPESLGRLPRPIQNGLVQFYGLAMMLATAVLLWALLSREG